MSLIIGLVGFIGSGKGSVGDFLIQDHGFIQDSFAAPLKDAASAIFGWDRQMLEGGSKDSREWREQRDPFWSKALGRDFTPRLALQLLGTEAGRNVFHQDVWVASLLNRYGQRKGNTVVTDVRFKNELKAIQDHGGIVVRVRRGPDPEWHTTAVLANHGDREALDRMTEMGIHPSEWDWAGLPVDHTIYNDGTLADLQECVRLFIVKQDFFLTSP